MISRKQLSSLVVLMTISLTFLFLLGIAGCKKENKQPPPQPPKYIMKLTTEIAKDGDFKILLNAEKADRSGVWIDLDNNGKKDDGEAVENFEKEFTFKLKSQTFSIHGKVMGLLVLNVHLTSIETKENPALKALGVSQNKIKSIDLSGNPALEWLMCDNQQDGFKIRELILNKNKELTWIFCSGNEIEKLDLSEQANLATLSCGYNRLTNLDVSKNPKLCTIYIEQNSLEKEALNKLYGQLKTKNEGEPVHIIYVTANPGAAESNEKIATGKGWTVTK